jgi:hypothetical protein
MKMKKNYLTTNRITPDTKNYKTRLTGHKPVNEKDIIKRYMSQPAKVFRNMNNIYLCMETGGDNGAVNRSIKRGEKLKSLKKQGKTCKADRAGKIFIKLITI